MSDAVLYRQPIVGTPDPTDGAMTGFILAEEEALKKYLSNITVPDNYRASTGDTTKVSVWYRFPSGERQIKYPFITIDLIDVAPDYPLWTSEYKVNPVGLYRPSVSPTLPENTTNKAWSVRPYLPFLLTYQVTVHCRSSLHDKYLASLFFTDIIPPRPFWIGVDTDNTWRRTEMVDFAQADVPETTESGTKRIFRKMYTLTMMAEIPQDRITEAWQVLKVLVPIVERDRVDQYLSTFLSTPLDPLRNVPQQVRTDAGELAYYYNDFKNANAGTATATGTASNT